MYHYKKNKFNIKYQSIYLLNEIILLLRLIIKFNNKFLR